MKQRRTYRAVEDESGCWIWQHGISSGGYARVRSDRVQRQIYERLVGPIPSGYQIHHVCGVKRCVNPAHLRSLTASEHSTITNGWDSGRCKRGHDITNPANLMKHANGVQCLRCHNEMQQRRRAKARIAQ